MADPKRMSLNTATVRKQWNLEQIIDGCARTGIRGISPWRDQIAECGLEHAAKLIREQQLTVTGLCRGGMFPASDKEGFRKNLEDNRRAVDEAATLGARCLVLVVGGLPDGSRDLAGAHAQVRDGIAELLEYSRTVDVPLAIEPLHPMYAGDRACVNTMAHANDLCDELGGGLGIAVDVYHVWWDPCLRREIQRAGAERILAFHVCDWLVPTRDLLLDRGMMGDGVIDIPAIRSWVEDVGYDDMLEVEIFSSDWWAKEPMDVLHICQERIASAV